MIFSYSKKGYDYAFLLYMNVNTVIIDLTILYILKNMIRCQKVRHFIASLKETMTFDRANNINYGNYPSETSLRLAPDEAPLD